MSDNPIMSAPPSDYYDEPTVKLAASLRQFDSLSTGALLRSGRFDLGDRGKLGMPLTLYAGALGNFEGLRQLLAAGASSNDVCDIGNGPMSLLEVAVGSREDQFMGVLLEYGASPNGVPDMDPPIFRAILTEKWGRMEKLLDAGADINLVDGMGRPPITVLALLRKYEKVHYLLERGADPEKGIETENDLASIIRAFPLSPSTEAGKWQQRIDSLLKTRKSH